MQALAVAGTFAHRDQIQLLHKRPLPPASERRSLVDLDSVGRVQEPVRESASKLPTISGHPSTGEGAAGRAPSARSDRPGPGNGNSQPFPAPSALRATASRPQPLRSYAPILERGGCPLLVVAGPSARRYQARRRSALPQRRAQERTTADFQSSKSACETESAPAPGARSLRGGSRRYGPTVALVPRRITDFDRCRLFVARQLRTTAERPSRLPLPGTE